MLKSRTKLATSPGAGKPRLPIDDRLDKIRAAQRTNLSSILALEKKGVRPIESPSAEGSIMAAAMRLLDGDDLNAPQSVSAAERLHALYHERAILEQALVIGQSRHFQAHLERVRRAAVERADEWRELVYQTAHALLTLQKCNLLRQQLQKELSFGGGPVINLPCAGFRLFGDGSFVGDEPYRFLQAVVEAGIMTAKEIEKCRTD